MKTDGEDDDDEEIDWEENAGLGSPSRNAFNSGENGLGRDGEDKAEEEGDHDEPEERRVRGFKRGFGIAVSPVSWCSQNSRPDAAVTTACGLREYYTGVCSVVLVVPGSSIHHFCSDCARYMRTKRACSMVELRCLPLR